MWFFFYFFIFFYPPLLLGSKQGDNRCSKVRVYHDKAEGGHTHRWLAPLEKAAFQRTHTHTHMDGRTLFAVCCSGGAFRHRGAATGTAGGKRWGGEGGRIPNTEFIFLIFHTYLFFFPPFAKCATKRKELFLIVSRPHNKVSFLAFMCSHLQPFQQLVARLH